MTAIITQLSHTLNKLIKQPLAIITLIIIILKCLKAHHTGIIMDEAISERQYSQSLGILFTQYDTPNNHLLNSFLLWILRPFIDSYDHWIRVPSIIASSIFTWTTFLIIRRTITFPLIAMATLLLTQLIPFIFNLSFLARGYSLSLAATIVLVYTWLRLIQDRQSRWSPKATALITLLNGLIFWSMLTNLYSLLAINCAGASLFLYLNKKGRRQNFQALILTALYSAIFSSLPYLWVIADIIKRVSTQGILFKYYVLDLLNNTIPFTQNINKGLLVGSGILFAWSLLGFFLTKTNKKTPYLVSTLFSGAVLLTLGLLFIGTDLFHISPAFRRNQLTLIVLWVLSIGICLDTCLSHLKKPLGILTQVIALGYFIGTVQLLYLKPPSLVAINNVDWNQQSAIGPLIRLLNQQASQKMWAIQLASNSKFSSIIISYYQQYGYNCYETNENSDIYVGWSNDPSPEGTALQPKLFQHFQTVVIKSEVPFSNKPASKGL